MSIHDDAKRRILRMRAEERRVKDGRDSSSNEEQDEMWDMRARETIVIV